MEFIRVHGVLKGAAALGACTAGGGDNASGL